MANEVPSWKPLPRNKQREGLETERFVKDAAVEKSSARISEARAKAKSMIKKNKIKQQVTKTNLQPETVGDYGNGKTKYRI
jgi:hypothetical protein